MEVLMRRSSLVFLVFAVALSGVLSAAEEPVDLVAVTEIRDQGFRHSQVMDLAWHLTEAVGPRLTGSPQSLAAHEWAQSTFEEWGLKAWLEEYDFGRSWAMDRIQVRMVAPYVQPLEALPEAWSPGTEGPVRGRVVLATLESDEDLEKWKGKLSGAIVLLEGEQKPTQIDADLFERWDGEHLQQLELYDIPSGSHEGWRQRMLKRFEFWPRLAAFYEAEGVVATVAPSSRDNGVVRLSGSSSKRDPGVPLGVPSLVMATEQYNRLVRLLDNGVEPELEIDVEVEFFEDGKGLNTLAEIPGGDLAGQVVMVGAHLDSWHPGTGATDNGGNCGVVMEAMRILQACGLKPRRTIVAALWSGEEQGFLGSRDYITRHLATRPEPTDPEQLALPVWARDVTWPIEPLPGFSELSAYFNTDYGAGRIRGLYAQENAAVVPIFEAWLAPFADLGADHVTMETAGGTDHLSFDRVGLPGFQFIQDDMDYSRTHHSNVDTYDHLSRDDMMQSAVILASVIWQAANRDQRLPRKPMPREPESRE
jgi:carboxypeptidase Q